MRFKGRMELEHGLKQIDIVPLVNIIFLLLIFFMFTPTLARQAGINVSLPKAATSEMVKYENLEILLTKDNAIYLNADKVSLQDLTAMLKQAAKRNQAVLIKADKHASLGRVVEIWDLARDLGLTQVNVATNQE